MFGKSTSVHSLFFCQYFQSFFRNQLAQLEILLQQPEMDNDLDFPRTEEDISEHVFETVSMSSQANNLPEHIQTEVRKLTPDEHLISSLFDVNRIGESNIDRKLLIAFAETNSILEILSSSSEESLEKEERPQSVDSLEFIDDDELKCDRDENIEAPLGEIIDEYIEDDYRNGSKH